ncbi:MAG: RimK family alpha-L-glutamate ligase [Anaerocolumna sp.]
MKGWLITNAFLHTHKFTEIHLWLTEAAKKLGVDLIARTNAEILVQLDSNFTNDKHTKSIEKPDFVLFWDKDVRLAEFLEMKGYPVFNSSRGIAVCDDKSLTHLYLQGAGIRMPKTILAPMTFSNIGYNNLEFLGQVEKELSYPVIIKECFGSLGQQVYLANNNQELKEKVFTIGAKPMLFQEFIKSSKGKDLRLQVVGNQVVAAMYRYSDNGDFRANISNGGKMKSYEPNQKQIDLAVECCKVLGMDFAGVDILFGKNQEPVICEVNSNAHFKNMYDCTGINVADSILSYIIKRICIGCK